MGDPRSAWFAEACLHTLTGGQGDKEKLQGDGSMQVSDAQACRRDATRDAIARDATERGRERARGRGRERARGRDRALKGARCLSAFLPLFLSFLPPSLSPCVSAWEHASDGTLEGHALALAIDGITITGSLSMPILSVERWRDAST
jgi:hypothetical protein